MYFYPYFYQYYFRAPNTTYSININTDANTLTLYKNGQFYKTYPVAFGKQNNLIPSTKSQRKLS